MKASHYDCLRSKPPRRVWLVLSNQPKATWCIIAYYKVKASHSPFSVMSCMSSNHEKNGIVCI